MKRLGLVAMLAAMLAAPAAFAQTTIKYSNWLPPSHQMLVKVFIPWMGEVEKATEGRVKFEILPKTVGTVPTQFDVVADGLADMALFVPGFTPGRFDLVEVIEIPLMSDEALVMNPASYSIYKKHLEKYNEFKGVQIVSIYSTGSGHIYTKKPINTLADMKGLKMRISLASNTPTMNAFGAIPVQRATNEIYELISSGVLDGVLIGREAAENYKLYEILNNLTVVPGGLYSSVLALAINGDKWKAISKKDQDTMMSLAGERMASQVGEAYHTADQVGVDAMKKAGKTVTVANDALMAEIRKALANSDELWLAKARKKGVPNPEQIVADLKSDIAARTKALAEKK